MRIYKTAVFALSFLLALSAAADEPGREFSAEAVVNTREGRNRMLMTFVVQRFTSVEELQNLAGVLENGGQFGLLSVLKGRRDGQLRVGCAEPADSAGFRRGAGPRLPLPLSHTAQDSGRGRDARRGVT